MSGQIQEKTRKGGIVIGIVIAIIIVILVGIIIYLLQSRNSQNEVLAEKPRNVVITPENVESVLQEIDEAQRTVDAGYYTVTMNPTWHFTSGNEASYDAVVENVETNTHDVYFDIVLESDEEKVLYKSPVIPRGGKLQEITLDETLDAGSYDCVAIYHLVDENQNTLSTLRIALEMIVEG